ncbi:MAG: hypothetical protein JO249_01120 [Acidobacteria bacterium]|nr:hypothetical protein [Acidobacteriota bacterium]
MAASKDSLLHVFDDMRKELELLCAEKARVAKRIAILKETMMNLVHFSADKELIAQAERLQIGARRRKSGLTELCRSILIESARPLTTREVCDRASEGVRHHQDALASVTTILARLSSYGQVERLRDAHSDQCTWRWAQNRTSNPHF